MEPVTHFLTGACIGRAGLNRITAYATLAATLGAEAPDIDTVWVLAGPVSGFAHHRGITHTFLAAPFMALAVTGLIWTGDRLLKSRRNPIREPMPESMPEPMLEPQRVRWLWVWIAALIAHFSHLLLDWTNNYGLRPFFPFDRHWYAGNLVFIADPILWALLLAAVIFPALLGLADREIGARRIRFRGRGWAIFALSGMVFLWCFRWAEQAKARNLLEAAQVTPTPAKRVALEPYPTDPFRWHALMETETTFQTAEIDARTHAVESDPRTNSIFKPPITPAVQVARQTRLAQVYLDWAQWPILRDVGPRGIPGQPLPDVPANRQWTTVELSDLRFAYAYLDTGMGGSSGQKLNEMLAASGLTGWIYVLDGREEIGVFLDGHEEK